MDTVSVVIATYKRVMELERAILSVQKQTYPYLEIIIIDDNVDVLISKQVKEIAQKYHIVYHKNVKNMGGALSRNEGLKIAHGKYIAFLDDDDEYLPKKIEKQVDLFIRSNIKNLGIVYCHTKALDDLGNIVEMHENSVRGDFLYENMEHIIAATSQWLCLKAAVEKIGGFRDVPSKQDSTFLFDMSLAGYRVDYVPEVLSIYHESNIERISSLSPRNLAGELIWRDTMREQYCNFSKMQIKKIEYNSAFKIYYMQLRLGLIKDAGKTLKLLIKNNQIGVKILPIIIKHPMRRFVKCKPS